jgi:pimeloyl-ACP methyl ester carboxylesterase
MTQVGIERAYILGVSMGGMIAQEFALHYPERVNKLILVCTNCGGSQSVPAAPEVLALLANRDVSPEEFKQRQFKLLFPDHFVAARSDKLERFWERVQRAPIPLAAFYRQIGAIQAFSTYDRLDQIQSPTLVLTGDEDILVPPQNSEILARRIPGARLEVFEGGGHGITGQFPERFCQVVEDFLG